MRLAEQGRVSDAAAMLWSQEFSWWMPLHTALLVGDLTLARTVANNLMARTETLGDLPPCMICQTSGNARLVVRDATGWRDDPDDFGGEWPTDYEPTPEFAGDIFCGCCGFSSGTSVDPARDEAINGAVASWSGHIEKD